MRVILIGGDETVYFLARQLRKKGKHITIINKNEMECQLLFKQTEATVIHGNGTDQQTLEDAGARQADVVLALTPHDQDNLVACQIAKKLFGVPRTIAIVNDPENEEVFEKLGVDHAFSATKVIGMMIEQRAAFDDIKRLMPVGEGEVHFADIQLDRKSPAIGKSMMDLNFSSDTLVACIIRDGEVIIPRGSNQLQVGDHVLLISKPGKHDKDIALLIGEEV